MTSSPRSLSDRLSLGVLDAASALYGAALAARNLAYDRGWAPSVRLECPVISIGNLSVGGTGKTACVEYLAARLHARGRRVAILSRGYQGRSGRRPYTLCVRDGRLLLDGQPTATDRLPDEPQVLAWHLPGVPVVVSRRRDLGGAVAIDRWEAEALLLDDGLQHRRLARALEIVLISAQMPPGGWPLLPRGPLREPLGSLRRAHILIVTKADQARDSAEALRERLAALCPSAVVATASHEPAALQQVPDGGPVPLERLGGAPVVLVSGLGDPSGFEQTVQRLGASVVAHAAYPDHHRYTAAEWRGIVASATASGAAAVVTTEKDWMRLRPVIAGDRGGTVPAPDRAGPVIAGEEVSGVAGLPTEGVSPAEGPATDLAVWVLSVRFRLLSGEDLVDARLAAVCAG